MTVASRSIDPDQPDIDTERACQVLGLSKESIYRLGRRGEIDGYILCGKRFWVLQSLRAYRERCPAAGLQLLRLTSVESRTPDQAISDRRQ